jgi:hypothetical protein
MRFVEAAHDIDRETLLDGRKARDMTKTTAAVELLDQVLADDEWHEKEGLAKLAGAQGISERTLERAAKELGVEREQHGFPATARWRRRQP